MPASDTKKLTTIPDLDISVSSKSWTTRRIRATILAAIGVSLLPLVTLLRCGKLGVPTTRSGEMSLFGRGQSAQGERAQAQSADEQAIARYRYMLKTAPPETIEQAHAEAFAQLTPEQRRQGLQKSGDS